LSSLLAKKKALHYEKLLLPGKNDRKPHCEELLYQVKILESPI
jgi:hypothetical protein